MAQYGADAVRSATVLQSAYRRGSSARRQRRAKGPKTAVKQNPRANMFRTIYTGGGGQGRRLLAVAPLTHRAEVLGCADVEENEPQQRRSYPQRQPAFRSHTPRDRDGHQPHARGRGQSHHRVQHRDQQLSQHGEELQRHRRAALHGVEAQLSQLEDVAGAIRNGLQSSKHLLGVVEQQTVVAAEAERAGAVVGRSKFREHMREAERLAREDRELAEEATKLTVQLDDEDQRQLGFKHKPPPGSAAADMAGDVADTGADWVLEGAEEQEWGLRAAAAHAKKPKAPARPWRERPAAAAAGGDVERLHGKLSDALTLLGTMLD